MKKEKIAWIVVITLLFMGVGLIPLSIISYSEKRMDLYYEDPSASAPVTIKIIGGIGPEKATTSGGWYTGLKGVSLRYRRLHIKIWLEIGDHYSYSGWIPQSNIYVKGESVSWSKSLSYSWGGSVTLQVPASKIVPYMKQEINETTGEILEPQKGTLPYDIRYQADIDGVLTKRSGSWDGTCYIQIVGSVGDYLPEAHSPGDPEPPEDSEDTSQDSQDNLADTEVKDEDGGSRIYTIPKGAGFLTQISLPVLVTLVVVVIFIAMKR